MCTVCTLCTLHNKQIRLDLLKTLLQYYGMSLEALPGVAYPGFRDNRSTLNNKTGYKKSYSSNMNDISVSYSQQQTTASAM